MTVNIASNNPRSTTLLNHGDKTLHLAIRSDLRSSHADSAKKEIETLLESAPVKSSVWTTLSLDLSSAKMVDSVGLNIIVHLYKEAKKVNAKTVVMISEKNIQRTVLFTRLDAHVQVIMANQKEIELQAISNLSINARDAC